MRKEDSNNKDDKKFEKMEERIKKIVDLGYIEEQAYCFMCNYYDEFICGKFRGGCGHREECKTIKEKLYDTIPGRSFMDDLSFDGQPLDINEINKAVAKVNNPATFDGDELNIIRFNKMFEKNNPTIVPIYNEGTMLGYYEFDLNHFNKEAPHHIEENIDRLNAYNTHIKEYTYIIPPIITEPILIPSCFNDLILNTIKETQSNGNEPYDFDGIETMRDMYPSIFKNGMSENTGALFSKEDIDRIKHSFNPKNIIKEDK